jgi:hypothetical protein
VPIIFHYVQQETPPAPYVLVSIGRFDGQASLADLPAKVDSAADRTVIPMHVATQLALDEIEQRQFLGLGSVLTTLSIYRAILTIRGFKPIIADTAGGPGEPHVLLGRDILNLYRIVLDGPGLRVEIGSGP